MDPSSSLENHKQTKPNQTITIYSNRRKHHELWKFDSVFEILGEIEPWEYVLDTFSHTKKIRTNF